ncbi:MAG TPA: Sua5/YciO/YrdC/YwlC family protein [Solirubrobacteraceae bacterium]|nr:Sua5/YciO/YrdC/YwlC family protein [Solirubrobacteraceae bacterium]
MGEGEGGPIAAPPPGPRPDAAGLDERAAHDFARCIAAGGVALFPADTVYGLACDPDDADAVRRLYELKGRPPRQPAAVMFFALAPALAALPELGPRTRGALERLLPGPLTLLLPNPGDRWPLACRPAAVVEPSDAAGLGEAPAPGNAAGLGAAPALGLRVPALPASLAALAAVGRPVLQSSANISGEGEARRLADVDAGLRAGVDLVLDGGELPGIASTVLDLRGYEEGRGWTVVRRGPVGEEEIALCLTIASSR